MKLFKVEKDTQVKEIAGQKFSSEHKESDLEDLIWKNPNILGENYLIFGRQESGKMGRLDLLGIHRDGYIVIFELKRGIADESAISQAIHYKADIKKYPETKFQELANDYFKPTDRYENTLKKEFENKFGESMPDLAQSKKRIKLVIIAHGLTEEARNSIDAEIDEERDISALLFDWFSNQETNEEFLLFYPYPSVWDETKYESVLTDSPKVKRQSSGAGIPEDYRKVISEQVLEKLQSICLPKIQPSDNRNIILEIYDRNNEGKILGYIRLRRRMANSDLQLFWKKNVDGKFRTRNHPAIEKNWQPKDLSDEFVQKVVNDTVKFAKSQIG